MPGELEEPEEKLPGKPKKHEERVRLVGTLLNNRDRPLKERFRALFTLKALGGPHAVDEISKCFTDPSALLRHELAYVLGQMGNCCAVPKLMSILENKAEETIVRHEAGEALGAIGDPQTRRLLEKYCNDESQAVAETCQLALRKVNWHEDPDLKILPTRFESVDPAPPLASPGEVAELKEVLLDPSVSLWDRYRVMFSLRNLGTDEAILALAEGLKCEESALFRHEIAFVLGQLQSPVCITQLKDCLSIPQENSMVRHECAEALGSIATPECEEILKQFVEDPERVVKESCEIGLDMCDYENSPELHFFNFPSDSDLEPESDKCEEDEDEEEEKEEDSDYGCKHMKEDAEDSWGEEYEEEEEEGCEEQEKKPRNAE